MTGDHEVLIQKYKIRSQRGVAWVTTYFKFWDPPKISGTAEDTNLKFCRHIDRKGILNEKMKKIGQKVT